MDEEELAEATAQINRELYVFEDRVAVLEAAPAAVGGGTATYTLLGSGSLVFNNRQFNFEAAEAAATRAAWDVSHHLELRFTLSAGRYVTREVRTVPQPQPPSRSTPLPQYIVPYFLGRLEDMLSFDRAAVLAGQCDAVLVPQGFELKVRQSPHPAGYLRDRDLVRINATTFERL